MSAERALPILALLGISDPTEEQEAGAHILRIAASDLRLIAAAHAKTE